MIYLTFKPEFDTLKNVLLLTDGTVKFGTYNAIVFYSDDPKLKAGKIITVNINHVEDVSSKLNQVFENLK